MPNFITMNKTTIIDTSGNVNKEFNNHFVNVGKYLAIFVDVKNLVITLLMLEKRNLSPTKSSSNMPNFITVNKTTITDTSGNVKNLIITLLMLKNV